MYFKHVHTVRNERLAYNVNALYKVLTASENNTVLFFVSIYNGILLHAESNFLPMLCHNWCIEMTTREVGNRRDG